MPFGLQLHLSKHRSTLEVEEADSRNFEEGGHILVGEAEHSLLEGVLEVDTGLEVEVVVEDIQRHLEEDIGLAALEADIHLDCTVVAEEVHIRRAGQEEGLEEEDTVRTEAVQGVELRKAAAEGILGEAPEAASHTLPEAVPVEDIPVEDPDNTTLSTTQTRTTTARKR